MNEQIGFAMSLHHQEISESFTATYFIKQENFFSSHELL